MPPVVNPIGAELIPGYGDPISDSAEPSPPAGPRVEEPMPPPPTMAEVLAEVRRVRRRLEDVEDALDEVGRLRRRLRALERALGRAVVPTPPSPPA